MALTTTNVIALAVICLFGIGLYGLLAMRNLMKVIVALQILGKCAILALVLAGRMQNEVAVGQSMALTAIVADTVVAVIGLSLAVQVRRHCGTLDVRALSSLRR